MWIRRIVPLTLAAAALPGCYFVKVAIPLDASGMAYPAQWAANTFSDQCERTGDRITGFPAALGAHFDDCWRSLTTDPRVL